MPVYFFIQDRFNEKTLRYIRLHLNVLQKGKVTIRREKNNVLKRVAPINIPDEHKIYLIYLRHSYFHLTPLSDHTTMDFSNNDNAIPGSYIKTISIIHFALIAGQVIFALAAFSVTKNVHFDKRSTGDPLFLVVPAVYFCSIFAGRFIFQKLTASLEGKATLKEKLDGYQTALIVRDALFEAPSLFAIVAFLTSGNLFYFIYTGFAVASMISLRPTREKIEDELKLSFEEKTGF